MYFEFELEIIAACIGVARHRFLSLRLRPLRQQRRPPPNYLSVDWVRDRSCPCCRCRRLFHTRQEKRQCPATERNRTPRPKHQQFGQSAVWPRTVYPSGECCAIQQASSV